VFILVIK